MSGIFLFILVCIAIILFLPSYFLLVSQKNSFEKQLAAVREGIGRENADTVESSIRDLNAKLASYVSRGNNVQLRILIKKILDAKPASVKLTGFYYQKGDEKQKNNTISLMGVAATRNSFLIFVKNLEAMQGVSGVQSLPSNLIKGENAAFTLTIKLAP